MKLAVAGIVAFVILGISARPTALQGRSAKAPSWNRESAARYLDERMDLWFVNAKKLRTDRTETICVSCHTSITYALSRPALRRAMHTSTATPQEVRLIEEVTRRVETYSTHQVMYEVDERKKIESRGTEAVLNTLILASADAAQARQQASEPTRKAFERLWETQRPDGAWDWLDFKLEPWETVATTYYGATLAGLAVGTVAGPYRLNANEAAPGIERLRHYLKEHYAAQSLFNRTWMLLASARLKDVLPRAQQDALITEIQSRQQDDGGWSLQSLGPWQWSKTIPPFAPEGTLDTSTLSKSDGYATGLIVYTLRQVGLSVDHPVVTHGLKWLEANQHEGPAGQRAWRAFSLNFDREHGGAKGEPWRRMFMSDAATAFAVLALVSAE